MVSLVFELAPDASTYMPDTKHDSGSQLLLPPFVTLNHAFDEPKQSYRVVLDF